MTTHVRTRGKNRRLRDSLVFTVLHFWNVVVMVCIAGEEMGSTGGTRVFFGMERESGKGKKAWGPERRLTRRVC